MKTDDIMPILSDQRTGNCKSCIARQIETDDGRGRLGAAAEALLLFRPFLKKNLTICMAIVQ
jgi:hypothetical protein